MNQLTYPVSTFGRQDTVADALPVPVSAAEARQARFGLRIAARLTEQSESLGPDLTERLRFAREQALARARGLQSAQGGAPTPKARSAFAWFGRGSSGWLKLAGALPVLALVAGLVLIQRWEDHSQVATAAEVDAALLSDDLPPDAYSDAGFAEFLKAAPQQQAK